MGVIAGVMMRVVVLLVLHVVTVMIMTVGVLASVQRLGFRQLRYSMG